MDSKTILELLLNKQITPIQARQIQAMPLIRVNVEGETKKGIDEELEKIIAPYITHIKVKY